MFIIDMPLNVNGDGPEMDDSQVDKTVYLVWDYDYIPVTDKLFSSREEAQDYIDSLHIGVI